MQKLIYIFIFNFIFSLSLFSQNTLNIYDVELGNYPFIKAKILGLDSVGRLISGYNLEDIKILENGKEIQADSLYCRPSLGQQAVKSVLTIDVSESMLDGKLSSARNAALKWVSMMNVEKDYTAVTTFSDKATLYSDFTNDTVILKKSLSTFEFGSGTNFNAGFIDPKAGAISISKNSNQKTNIIFLTDGIGIGDEKEIIAQALEANVRIYCITFKIGMPDMLKNISKATGGQWFDNIQNEDDLIKAYTLIRKFTENTSYCELFWRSGGCMQGRTAEFFINSKQLYGKYQYNNPFGNMSKFEVSPLEYFIFDGIRPPNNSTRLVKVKAINDDIEVQDIKADHKFFRVTRIFDKSLPFTLKKDSTFELEIEFAPTDSTFAFCNFEIVGTSCTGNKFYGIGGNPSLSPLESFIKVISPNGGEKYPATSKTAITWENSLPNEKIKVDVSLNSGKHWFLIDQNAIGKTTSWSIPNIISDSCLVRVTQFSSEYGKFVGEIGTDSAVVNSVDWNRDASLIAVASSDTILRIINPVTKKRLVNFKAHTSSINDVVWSPDAVRLASVGSDSMLVIWNSFSKEIIAERKVNSAIRSVAWSPNGWFLVTACDNGTIYIWNPNKVELIDSIKFHKRRITDLKFTYNNQYLLAASADTSVTMWNVYNWSLRKHIKGYHIDVITSLAIRYDNQQWASGSLDKSVRIFNFDGEQLCQYKNHTSGVLSISWNPFKNLIASSGQDSKIKIWEPCGNDKFDFFRNWHQNSVTWSPDGNRVMSGAGGKTNAELAIFAIDAYPFQQDVSDKFFSIVKAQLFARDLNFGKVKLKKSKNEQINDFLQFNGNIPVTVNKIVISGRDADAFKVVSDSMPYTVFQSIQSKLYFAFTPKFKGQHIAKITIFSTIDSIQYSLYGEGIESDLIAEDLDFGELRVGDSITIKKVLLRNNSTLPVSIDVLELTENFNNAFKIVSKFDGFTLAAKGQLKDSKEIEIQFNANLEQRMQANIKYFYADDSISASIYGNGIKPVLSFSGDNDFGELICENEQKLDFEIVNTGNGTLTIDSIYIDESMASHYEINPKFQDKIQILANEKLALELKFKPQSIGNKDTKLNILANSINSQSGDTIIDIRASKYNLQYALETNNIEFNNLEENENRLMTFKIFNTGDIPLDWSLFFPVQLLNGKFEIMDINPSITLPNDFSIVQIRFNGGKKGETYDTSYVFSDFCGNLNELNFKATIRNKFPTLQSKKVIDLGTISCSNENIFPIEIENIGLDELKIIDMILDDNTNWSISEKPNFQIKSLEKDTLYLQFTPNVNGVFSNSIKIFSNADNNDIDGYYEIKLIANFQKAEFKITQNEIKFEYKSLAYPGNQKFNIDNTGRTALYFTMTSSNSDLEIISINPEILEPNQSAEIEVRYKGNTPNLPELYELIVEDSCLSKDTIFVRLLPAGVGKGRIKIASKEAKSAEEFTLPIILENSQNLINSGVEGIKVSLSFNNSLLYPIATNNIGKNQRGLRTIELDIPLLNDENGAVIYEPKFIATWGNDSISTLNLFDAEPYGKNLSYAEIETIDGEYKLLDLCYAGGKGRLFYADGVIQLNVINPEEHQNFATINYTLVEDAFTEIILYNILGEVVKTIYSGYHSKGDYQMQLDLTDLPVGAYFIILRTPNHELIKRINLIK